MHGGMKYVFVLFEYSNFFLFDNCKNGAEGGRRV